MANLNERDEHNRTLLHKCVFENNLELARDLLKKGADASVTSNEGNTSLHIAASRKHHEILEILLKYTSRDKLKKFIDAKTTGSGSTALHVATSNGCVKSVRHLLSHGANFQVKNNDGKRALNVAADEAVKKLLVSVELDAKLAEQGKYQMLRMRMFQYSKADLAASISARNDKRLTSLQMAVMNNHCNTVHAIAEARVDRLQGDYATNESACLDELIVHGKKSSEHQASLMLHSQDVNMMGEGITEEVAEILAAAHNIVKIADKVFRPDNGEPYEQSSLLAVVEETLEVLQFKPGHVTYDKRGKIIFRGHKARYYKMLRINDGTDEDYDDFEDEDKIVSYMAILQVAITRAIAMFMRSIYMVKMSVAAKDNDLAMFEQCIEEQFIDVNIVDQDRRTPLHYAAENGNETMVAMLLKKKADVTLQTKSNEETALHLAVKKAHVQIIRLLLQSVPNEYLLEMFVDMATSNERWTAVHFAAKTGRLEVLKCLLQHHATYDLKDKNAKTPVQLSESLMVTGFFVGIEELFQMAQNGDANLMKKLTALQSDDLLAVGNARNHKGHTLGSVAKINGHRAVATQISKMLKKATPAAPKNQGGVEDMDEHFYEIERYQLIETLSKSST